MESRVTCALTSSLCARAASAVPRARLESSYTEAGTLLTGGTPESGAAAPTQASYALPHALRATPYSVIKLVAVALPFEAQAVTAADGPRT